MTASTAPDSTWAPGVTESSETTPSVGAVMVCCIFIASRTTTTSPLVTCCPSATATVTTAAGIGARSDPSATTSAGSTNVGTGVRVIEPCGPSTSTQPSPTATSYVSISPSTSSTTCVGDASTTVT